MQHITHFLDQQIASLGAGWHSILPVVVVLAYAMIGSALFFARRVAGRGFFDEEVEKRGSSAILGPKARQLFVYLTQPFIRLLFASKIPASAITSLSTLLVSAAAFAVALGHFAFGGWLYLVGGACDFFDGRIARANGTAGPQGSALDSVLDRYADLVFVVGLCWYYRDSWVLLVLGVLAIGSALVPYVRAKGGELGVEVKVGLMQRPERVAYLGLAVALSPLVETLLPTGTPKPFYALAVVTVALIATASFFTGFYRLFWLLRALGQPPPPAFADRPDVARFRICSVAATVGDLLLVITLLQNSSISPALATFLGCAVGTAGNALFDRLWAFGVRGQSATRLGRYALASTIGAFLNAGGVAMLQAWTPTHILLSWGIVRAAVFLCWSLPLSRDYLLKDTPAPGSAVRHAPTTPNS